MKKIGLVGGTGPESTLAYYKKLNEEIDRVTGEKSMPGMHGIAAPFEFRELSGSML